MLRDDARSGSGDGYGSILLLALLSSVLGASSGALVAMGQNGVIPMWPAVLMVAATLVSLVPVVMWWWE